MYHFCLYRHLGWGEGCRFYWSLFKLLRVATASDYSLGPLPRRSQYNSQFVGVKATFSLFITSFFVSLFFRHHYFVLLITVHLRLFTG